MEESTIFQHCIECGGKPVLYGTAGLCEPCDKSINPHHDGQQEREQVQAEHSEGEVQGSADEDHSEQAEAHQAGEAETGEVPSP